MTPRMRMRGYGGAAVVVLTATVAWLMVQQPIQEDETAKANATASKALRSVTEIQKQVDANASALADANRRLVALGKAPVPVPSPPAQVSQDEFTAEEAAAVRVIVADLIARTPAKITQAEVTQIARVASAFVVKPKDGKTPTAAELTPIVKVVLAQYCTEDRCVGPRGPDGEKGDPAPAVTDAQLLAASAQSLAAYCGQPEKPCQGKDGVDGKDAPPPYSQVDSDCVGDGDQSFWRIYVSNGTDQKSYVTKGPCRIGPDPD